MTGLRSVPLGVRLFLTAWLIYGLHFATNVVREHYPAFSLAERGTMRVDAYLGLHPDLFEVEGRGAFINNNPGASLLAAIPYALARPAVDWAVARAARARDGEAVTARYDDPRPNRRAFFRAVRERGLDVRFGLAIGVIHLLCTAPLSAAAVVVMWRVLRRSGFGPRAGALLAMLYAFGTPIFFRSGYLSHNLLVAHTTLFAFALLYRSGEEAPDARQEAPDARQEAPDVRQEAPDVRQEAPDVRRLVGAGAFLGFGVLCDYSGVIPAVALGVYALFRPGATDRLGAACGRAGWLALGAAGPIAVLLGYQAWAFGSPFFPAQHYMPATQFSALGWNGLDWPAPALILGNLLDDRFGIFAFGPLLVTALVSPWLRRRPGDREGGLAGAELALALSLFAALLLFSSANQYARLQWNTGFRMLAPAVPLLFLATATVLARLPRPFAVGLGALSVAHSSCLAMAREDAVTSVLVVARDGPTLPWLTVLLKMSDSYASLAGRLGPQGLLVVLLPALVLAIVWWPVRRTRAVLQAGADAGR